jgi:hypothetical protein
MCDVNPIVELESISRRLQSLLHASGIEDIQDDPEVRRQVARWTTNVQGSSLLEALCYLFVGCVAVRGVLMEAASEATLPPKDCAVLDVLGVPDRPTLASIPVPSPGIVQ